MNNNAFAIEEANTAASSRQSSYRDLYSENATVKKFPTPKNSKNQGLDNYIKYVGDCSIQPKAENKEWPSETTNEQDYLKHFFNFGIYSEKIERCTCEI